MELIPSQESSWLPLANELEELNATLNNGRGVSVVRSIVAWLKRGNTEYAKREAQTDHDKIRNYPEVRQILEEKLFEGVSIDDW